MSPRWLVALLLVATSARAHDFWLQPQSWRLAAGGMENLTLQVGHGADRQRSPIAASRIIRFEAVGPQGRVPLRGGLRMGEPGRDAEVRFPGPGAYMVVLETDDRAESHLPADRYNDYLLTEGLTPAIELRAHAGRSDADGAENYSRHAKAIVQIGPDDGDDAHLLRPLGLSLEIVPEVSPARLGPGATLPVRIYYQGLPLAGALVKLTDLADDAKPVATQRSDTTGRARFLLPREGQWLVNVIWTRPQSPDRLSDFETDFSSLTFAVAAR